MVTVLIVLVSLMEMIVATSPHPAVTSASAAKCSETENNCMNGGTCRNGTCICADGWQGDECQFCGGKVRLTDPTGSIHDGAGNYSIGVKCSWLIDAREHGNTVSQKDAGDRWTSIRLHLEEFATECGWDHLYVYDGDSVESPLLAVFSGLMYRSNYSVRRIPEVVAHSGSALLHFFSDDAYNMSGFNISYRINGCPSAVSHHDCSNQGDCIDGECICDRGYKGIACHQPVCPANCSETLGQGRCDLDTGGCVCGRDFTGDDCSQVVANGYWSVVQPEFSSPAGSASHGAAVWGDTLHIIGGESYGRGKLMSMYDFNGNVWELAHTSDKKNTPDIRYGASTVMYGDKIFIYGGVVKRKGRGVSNELWAFDVNAKTWENITVKADACNSSNVMCGPLHSAGHTATLVPGYESGAISNSIGSGGGVYNNHQYMVVIFGHSPKYGYLNTVQEYNFGTREWKIVNTKGFPIKGGYGHSASYDWLTERIYVYGGIISENESSQILSSRLYSYQPGTRTWTMLTSAPSARFLHTANFITPGLMIVFGGNTHNDTSHSFGAKCYSRDLIVYDVVCDSWHIKAIPNELRADLPRFGHSAVVFEKALYIYGGFDGQMLGDMLKYVPGDCHQLTRSEACLMAHPGVKCVWDIQKSICLAAEKVQRGLIFSRDQDIYQNCAKESRIKMTQQHLLDVEKCAELSDCQSCLSNSYGCTYCGRGTCTKDAKCRELDNQESLIYPIKQVEQCTEDAAAMTCEKLHNCLACGAENRCFWDYESSKCRALKVIETNNLTNNGNKTVETEMVLCPPSCASLTSCANCTVEECIWCQNEQRCVDKNAYTASFPYGQCREWTTMASKCRQVQSGANSQCNFYKTCGQCRDDPACGWCDDGSHTGVGKCLPGGDRGPQEEMECHDETRWHFTHCPRCQCNGHSTCLHADGHSTCKQPCGNLTMGKNCEKCQAGYFGDPINGGTCQKCVCNGQASQCNGETGKCFCNTKGLTGDHCEKCDATNHYHGDPSKGSCYYELTIDYQFTFNLSKKEDRHFTQINFRNSPGKPDVDADFMITCSVPAKMNITIRTAGGPEKPVFLAINCSTFRHRFSKTEHHFGVENNVTLTTFYVYVYDFQPPLWIQIAFSQYPKLNLQQFFITFSSCFLLLLLMAAFLWKVKQKYDMWRRRQRLFVEMEQMASRPFSQVQVEIENREVIELSPAVENITTAPKKRKKDSPSPIALEPCNGNRAAVLSLLVRLPTEKAEGGLQHAPAGQAAGLAVASALVTLGNPRRPSIDHPKEPKNKRKQSQHPDSCI